MKIYNNRKFATTRKLVSTRKFATTRAKFSALQLLAFVGTILVANNLGANPEDGHVVAGAANIVADGATRLNIIQNSAKVVIDWRDFSIQLNEHTDFQQPGSQAIALNRVTGNESSSIFGRLTANGRIFLINPNGILFGASAQVDVGGLLATSTDIANDDFMAGYNNFNLPGDADASVINQGNITIAEGGMSAFVAPGVENTGVIFARLGQVTLASGNRFTLDLYGDQLVQFALDDEATQQLQNGLAANSGEISADGGTVVLTTADAGNMIDSIINMDGVIEARSVGVENGEIILSGGANSEIIVSGNLDVSGLDAEQTGGQLEVSAENILIDTSALLNASGDSSGGNIKIKATAATEFLGAASARGEAKNGSGGFVEVSGDELSLGGTIDVGAASGSGGTILFDPTTFDIGASEATTLVTSLDSGGSVIVQASETINVNADIDSSAQAGSATLYFQDSQLGEDPAPDGILDINLNATITLGASQTLSGEASTVNVMGPAASIQNGIDVAASAATINVAAGEYLINSQINVNKAGLTLLGADGSLVNIGENDIKAFNISASDTTLAGFDIFGADPRYADPLATRDWTGESSAGVSLAGGLSNVTLANNNISNVRSGMLLPAGSTGDVSNNLIDNTKGSFIIRNNAGYNLTGNSAGPTGNEWDIVFLENVVAGPGVTTPDAPRQTELLDFSLGNNGMTVLDRGYHLGNRSHVLVSTTGSAVSLPDDFGLGSGWGSIRQPYDSINDAISAIFAGGWIEVGPGTYDEGFISISKALTLSGPNAGISPINGVREAEAILTGATSIRLEGDVDDVTIQGLRFQDISGIATSAVIHSNPGGGQSHDRISILSNSFINIERHAIKTNASNDQFVISDNKVDGVTGANFSGFQIFYLNNGEISNNEISNTSYSGMNLDSVTDSFIWNNTISNTQSSGIQIANSPDSFTVIGDNVITNANMSNALDKGGIAVYSNSSYIALWGNVISDSNNGVVIRDKPGGDTLTEVYVYENKIFDNSGFAVANFAPAGIVDASSNWWGSTDEVAVSAMMSGAVDFSPFLMSGTDMEPGLPGFWGDFSSLTVTALGEHSNSYYGMSGRIQEGIYEVDDGGTVNISAGTYIENVTIDKAVKLVGAGRELTTLAASSGSSLLIDSDIGSLATVSVSDIGFSGANGATRGLYVAGNTELGDLIVSNTQYVGHSENGFAVIGTQSPTPSASQLGSLQLIDAVFSNNGKAGGSGGRGDLLLFYFNNDAILRNIQISNDGTTDARYGLQMRGIDDGAFAADFQAMGNVSLENVSIAGTYGVAHLGVQGFDGVDTLSMIDVTLGSASSRTGWGGSLWVSSVAQSGATVLDLGNTNFSGTLNLLDDDPQFDIVTAFEGPDQLVTVDATAAAFKGIATASMDLNALFATADNVFDQVDHGSSRGFVKLRSGNVYVTQGSHTIAAGAIQRGINLTASGASVNIQAGIYDEILSIPTPLTLAWSEGGVTINSLTTAAAGTISMSGNLTATSSINLSDALQLQGDLSLNSSGAITLNSINGSVAGSEDLTLNGNTVNLGVVGATAALSDLAVTALTVGLDNITTIGQQSYSADMVNLAGNYSAGSFLLTGDALLSDHTSIDTSATNGAIEFTGEIDGMAAHAQNLTLNAGDGNVTTVNMGQGIPLGDLIVTAGIYDSSTGTSNVKSMTVNGGEILLGSNTINSIGDVNIDADSVIGSINADNLMLTATGTVTATVNTVNAASISADDIFGSVTAMNANLAALNEIDIAAVIESLIATSVTTTLAGQIDNASIDSSGDVTINTDSIAGTINADNLTITATGTVDTVITATSTAAVTANDISGSITATTADLAALNEIDITAAIETLTATSVTTTLDGQVDNATIASSGDVNINTGSIAGTISGNNVTVNATGSVDTAISATATAAITASDISGSVTATDATLTAQDSIDISADIDTLTVSGADNTITGDVTNVDFLPGSSIAVINNATQIKLPTTLSNKQTLLEPEYVISSAPLAVAAPGAAIVSGRMLEAYGLTHEVSGLSSGLVKAMPGDVDTAELGNEFLDNFWGDDASSEQSEDDENDQ